MLEKEIIILFTELIKKMPNLKQFLAKKKSLFLLKIEEMTFT
jgi:hypothetical protein